MIDVSGKCSEKGRNESCVELAEGSHRKGIEVNEGWNQEKLWNREPSSETVERLIEWFSDKRN